MSQNSVLKNKKSVGNIALIDAQNVRLGSKSDGWIVDYCKMRIYLKENCGVDEAYIFFGYWDKQYQKLYDHLQRAGFKIPKDFMSTSRKKGNAASSIISFAYELAISRKDEFNKVVLVSGDGDYIDVVRYLLSVGKFHKILFPNRKKASSLYKQLGNERFDYLYKYKKYIEYKK